MRLVTSLAICLAFMAALASAQNTGPKPRTGGSVIVSDGVLNSAPTEFILAGQVVKGAPYSAEAVSETVQLLADGNRISHSTSYKIFRDSEGRTRREMGEGATLNPLVSTQFFNGQALATFAPDGSAIIISDPVGGVNYSLNEKTKTARKMPIPRIGDTTRVLLGGAMAQPSSLVGADKVGQGTWVKMPDDPNVVTESLGKQVIEGVESEGTRSTRTIPAGTIGNEQPIVVTSETWYSRKLQTTVLSKRHDPRIGDTTFRLTDLSQSEPAAQLFQVPGDYNLIEPTSAVTALPLTATTPSAGWARTDGPSSGCATTQRVQISQGVAESIVVSKVDPVYPPLAQQARIQGSVAMQVVIGCDGTIQNIRLISGHPMLAPSAIEAVKQWRFKPYLLNNQAVQAETTLTIDFGGSSGPM